MVHTCGTAARKPMTVVEESAVMDLMIRGFQMLVMLSELHRKK